MRELRRALASVSLAVPLAIPGGCAAYSDLQFVQDHRLEFTRPEHDELVETPLTVSWEMDGFDVLPAKVDEEPAEDAGYFAVFVDRAPIKPDRTLEDVAGDDEACKQDPRCPDRQYLSAKGVYVTHAPRLTLDVVAPLPNKQAIQQHEITVILLDAEGQRIGESAWFQQFEMENRTPSQ